MRCPFCGFDDQKVLESRPARDGEAIRRRRECLACGRRFTTCDAAASDSIAVAQSRSIFVKLVGPESEIDDKVRDAFRELCASIRD